MMDSLRALREELDRNDEALLELLQKRMALVQRVVEEKVRTGLPLFDRAREQDVRERFKRHAARLQLPWALVESVLAALLDGAHDLQEEVLAATPCVTSGSGVSKRFVIVGGAGKMGLFFERVLSEAGHTVQSIDRNDKLDQTVISDADIVVLSVPIEITSTVAAQVGPWMRKDALLCDVASLKEPVCKVYESQCHCECVGLHPMFGPTATSLRRQKVIACVVRDGPSVQWLLKELGRYGAEVLPSDPTTHDKMMAVIQVLLHFGKLTLGQSLAESGVSLKDTLRFTSPIYRLELAVIGRLFAQDPALYSLIQTENSYGKEMRERYKRACDEFLDLLDHHDQSAFIDHFKKSQKWFAGFSKEALELSDLIIEEIVSRA